MNYILLYFIFLILLAISLYWIFKKLLKTILIVGLIFFILTAFIAYATYLDVKELTQRLPNEQSAFLLVEDNNLLTGITFNPSQKENFKILSEQELNQGINILLKTNFKVITLDLNILKENLPEEITINEQASIPKDQFIKALKSNDPLSELDLKTIFKNKFSELPEEITNENLKKFIETQNPINNINLKDKSNVKALLLASSVQSLSQKNPLILLQEFKKGNLKIYKETITFKILKSIPDVVINQITQKIPQSL